MSFNRGFDPDEERLALAKRRREENSGFGYESSQRPYGANRPTEGFGFYGNVEPPGSGYSPDPGPASTGAWDVPQGAPTASSQYNRSAQIPERTPAPPGQMTQPVYPTPPHRQTDIARNIPTLSPEDMRVLSECNRESFYTRCLPLGIGFCFGVNMMEKQLKLPLRGYRYFLAGMLGWLVGKMSYKHICEEKLMNSSSDSPFVQLLRKKYRPDSYDSTLSSDFPQADFSSYPSSEFGPPASAEFVDPFKPKDDVTQEPLSDYSEVKPSQRFTTYDELRAKNRAGYRPL